VHPCCVFLFSQLSRCGFLPQILATDVTNKGFHDEIMAECPEMVANILKLDESLDVCTPFAPAFCCLLMICADLDCIRASVDSCLWWGRQLFKVRFWFDLFLELSPVHWVELVVSQEIQLWNADMSAALFAEQQLSFFPSYVASIFSQLSKVCREIPSFRGCLAEKRVFTCCVRCFNVQLPGLESAIPKLKAVQEYYCGLSASYRIAALL
jgi:hypothetical protein